MKRCFTRKEGGARTLLAKRLLQARWLSLRRKSWVSNQSGYLTFLWRDGEGPCDRVLGTFRKFLTDQVKTTFLGKAEAEIRLGVTLWFWELGLRDASLGL